MTLLSTINNMLVGWGSETVKSKVNDLVIINNNMLFMRVRSLSLTHPQATILIIKEIIKIS